MISTALQDGLTATADSGDVRAEFQELLTGCGIHELNWRGKATLTGSDRVRWLNGIITNNIRDLSPGQGVYAFLLNPQGRILGDLYAYARAESLVIDTDAAQLPKILELFDHYIIMDDVEVSESAGNINAIGLKGPSARAALQAAGIDLPELQPLSFADVTWGNIPVVVIRGDAPRIEAYEIWASPESIGSIRDTLEKSGAKPVGTTALDYLRIAGGIPQYGQDIRQRDLT